jgi:Uma2 family endonuclease
MREIVLPETKPASEWVNGRVLQKMSPQRKHSLAQTSFASELLAWARERGSGRVGTEWEFRLEPPGEVRRPLVPDVAYISYARLPYDAADDVADIPRIAPDIVVEILSPGDRKRDLREKIDVYLARGTSAVFEVNTSQRTVVVHDRREPRTFGFDSVIEHESLPGFAMPTRTLFEEPPPKEK